MKTREPRTVLTQRRPRLKTIDALVRIYDAVGESEFMLRDIPTCATFWQVGNLRRERFVQSVRMVDDINVWKITQEGIKLVMWYKG